ncbi:MAG: DUF1064 domain-containing protein [Propionibacteriaceae bacterium]|nr:DUF1064 domain-containing protein [Propionibacteriaceae bacterium]
MTAQFEDYDGFSYDEALKKCVRDGLVLPDGRIVRVEADPPRTKLVSKEAASTSRWPIARRVAVIDNGAPIDGRRELAAKRSEHRISFDSPYEYDYYLYLLGLPTIAAVIRNTARLRFKQPSTCTIPETGYTWTADSYTPDFIVFHVDGHATVVELKGWNNARGEAARRGVKRDYPHLTVRRVEVKELKSIQARQTIDGWIRI